MQPSLDPGAHLQAKYVRRGQSGWRASKRHRTQLRELKSKQTARAHSYVDISLCDG